MAIRENSPLETENKRASSAPSLTLSFYEYQRLETAISYS